ncbi:MAG: gamma-glutamylcyclotransferase [Chitinophagaceae bacterium]|nr:gamma-glutamylcyclotransferase [Chitinophagaceae bacterium]
MQPEIFQLFVYGSLRKGFQHPAYGYISRYFTLVSDATVNGALYDMGQYPAAVPDNGSRINGELYRINNPDEFSWAMAQLDDYEGVNTEAGERPLYRREPVAVYIGDRTESAWIYWFNGEVDPHARIDTGDVLEYLQRKNQNPM